MKYNKPKSLCCNRIMVHVPDNVHWHYQCPKCKKEYDLDEKTERREKNMKQTLKNCPFCGTKASRVYGL